MVNSRGLLIAGELGHGVIDDAMDGGIGYCGIIYLLVSTCSGNVLSC